MNRFAITIILALASLSAWPQAAPISGSVINQYGQPVAGANVRICSVTSSGTPCSPVAAIFSDVNLTQSLPNPTQTDVNGNFVAFVGALPFPNLYTIQTFPVPANPSGLPYTWVEPGPWCSLGGCTFTGNITAPVITATSEFLLQGSTPTTITNSGITTPQLTASVSVTGASGIFPNLNGLPAEEYHTTSANPTLLTNFWRYLHATPVYQGTYLSAGMDIILPNDSLWEGDWTNSQGSPLGCGPNTAVPQYSQNRQAEQIRISLQSQYGYGGTGLQPVMNVMGCNLVNPELYTASPTSITLTTEIGPQYLTNGSVVVMTAGQTITWNGGGLSYTFARIYCADDSTSNAMAITIDGVSVGSACGTHNSSPIARVFTTTPNQPNTNHSLVATCTSGHCLLYGVEGRPSTGGGNAGVRVHNTSVGSAPSAWFTGHTDFEDLITDGVLTPSAQLVIYAMGTNDASLGIGVPTYTTNFTAYITHELAKPGEPPVVVIYRPGLDSIASQSYFAALTAYGYANNLLVIDQTNRWGTGCTTGCWWLGNDNVHMNDGANLDASHTMLTALTDVMHGQPIAPLIGDTGLNAGVVRVTAPAFSGFIGVPGFVWDGVPGVPDNKGFYAWQTGNPASLPGVVGLADPNYLGLVFGANANNDFCVQVPTSGGNFSTCAGNHFRVVKSTGEVDTVLNVLDDGSGNMGAAGLITGDLGVKTGTSAAQPVYRCATAGTLPAGALTTVTANCGTTTATGLTVN